MNIKQEDFVNAIYAALVDRCAFERTDIHVNRTYYTVRAQNTFDDVEGIVATRKHGGGELAYMEEGPEIGSSLGKCAVQCERKMDLLVELLKGAPADACTSVDITVTEDRATVIYRVIGKDEPSIVMNIFYWHEEQEKWVSSYQIVEFPGGEDKARFIAEFSGA